MSCGYTLLGIGIFVGAFKHSNLLSYVMYSVSVLSTTSMVMLTVDRCVLICWPFRYQSLHPCFHVFFMSTGPVIALLLFLGNIMSVSGHSDKPVNENKLAVDGFLYGMPFFMLSLLISNILVYITLKKQKRAIKSLNVIHKQTTENQHKVFERKKEILAFYICFGCVITYVVLRFPAFLFKLMQFKLGVALNERHFSYMIALVHLDPLSDAIILVWFNKELRQRIKSVCRGRRRIWNEFTGTINSFVIPSKTSNSTTL